MTPRCRICAVKLTSNKERYQMTRRAPQDLTALRQWWLCASDYEDVCRAIDTARELFFGPVLETVTG